MERAHKRGMYVLPQICRLTGESAVMTSMLILLLPVSARGQSPRGAQGVVYERTYDQPQVAGMSYQSWLLKTDARATLLGHPLMSAKTESDSTSSTPQRECVSPTVIPQIILGVPLTVLIEGGVAFAYWGLDGQISSDSPVGWSLIIIPALTVVDGPAIWGVGKIFGGEGSMLKTSLGVTAGSLIMIGLHFICFHPKEESGDSDPFVTGLVYGFIPVLGGIVGFNLR